MKKATLLKAVAGEIGGWEELGAVRETFFAHQVKSAGLSIRIPGRADFIVEGRHLFEIGGRRKGKDQIDGLRDAFVVRDDIEVGSGGVIPLWLFGFLY